MKNSLVGLTVGIVCAIVMIGTVLVPNINDIVDGNVTTYENEGTGAYYEVDPDEDITIEVMYDDWYLNGESYDISDLGANPIVTTDTCRVSMNGRYFQYFDETGVRVDNVNIQTYAFTLAYDVSESTFTIYMHESTTTSSDVSATYTHSISHLMYYNASGDYVAYTSEDGTVAPSGYYVNSLSDVICGGAYTTGELDTSYFGQGETVTVGVSTYTASATATTENVLADVLTVSDYTVTVTDGTATESFIPYTIYVPAAVEGHTTEQTTINTLYGIISLFIILAVLCAVTYAVMRNRD